MTLITNRNFAMQRKTEHAFKHEVGYVNRGPLRMPATPMHPAQFCEPPIGTQDQSIHMLKAPQSPEDNAVGEVMTWHEAEREWAPLSGLGKRLAFSSAYLAAHGWTYAGACEHEIRHDK